jgi:hypothetical protein
MNAVRRRGGKAASPQHPKGDGVPERLIRTLETFSRTFGDDVVPAKHLGWSYFCELFAIRDRLTHPLRANDVDFRIKHLEIATAALGWYLEDAQPATLLDRDKIADCLGARPPVA